MYLWYICCRWVCRSICTPSYGNCEASPSDYIVFYVSMWKTNTWIYVFSLFFFIAFSIILEHWMVESIAMIAFSCDNGNCREIALKDRHSAGIWPFTCWIFQRGHKHIFTFCAISPHWCDAGSWNPSSNNTRTYLFYIVNIMVADVLAT